MIQRPKNEFFQLIVVSMMVVGLFFSFALLPSVGHSVEITFENCEPETWVGGVRWLDNRTTYEDVPGLELKSVGSLVVDLEPGDYGITHYRPRKLMVGPRGNFWRIPAVLDYRDITITGPAVHSFGCEE